MPQSMSKGAIQPRLQDASCVFENKSISARRSHPTVRQSSFNTLSCAKPSNVVELRQNPGQKLADKKSRLTEFDSFSTA